MIRYFAIVASVSTLLGGCQTSAPAVQSTDQLREVANLRVRRDAGEISYTEWAERTGAAAKANVALNADQWAAIDYRSSLARRVDAGELTPAQFESESARTLRRLKAKPGQHTCHLRRKRTRTRGCRHSRRSSQV